MAFYIKDSILKFIGYTLIIFGIFMLAAGIGMMFDPDPTDRMNGPSIAVISMAFAAPGILLVYLGIRAGKDEILLKSVAALARTHRRITTADLAEKLRIPIHTCEKLIARAITDRLLKGNFDRTTGEFYTDEAAAQTVEMRYCPSCGAPLGRVYLQGETVRCENCGTVF
ncbi:MAG: hypothetical protein CVV44_23105 [Spirochaetae bacterium HGW-Spirochaetae-1]|jgi:hypothetical protein|nr:MAG: hypothetical protein CVV44_23105 [Spirochaetae bacterium HGW-Spirochaetae-1]